MLYEVSGLWLSSLVLVEFRVQMADASLQAEGGKTLNLNPRATRFISQRTSSPVATESTESELKSREQSVFHQSASAQIY